MKSTIISMLIVLVILAIVPMIFMGDNDLMSDFFGGSSGGKESIASLKAKAPKNLTSVTTDSKMKVYKWVDENGVTQFSQTPPRLGGESESIMLQPDTNIMQAYKAPVKQAEKKQGSKIFKLGSPYTPGGMKDLVDQTAAVTDQMNARQAEQQKLMQQVLGKQ
jgi:hypothetical protein